MYILHTLAATLQEKKVSNIYLEEKKLFRNETPSKWKSCSYVTQIMQSRSNLNNVTLKYFE